MLQERVSAEATACQLTGQAENGRTGIVCAAQQQISMALTCQAVNGPSQQQQWQQRPEAHKQHQLLVLFQQ